METKLEQNLKNHGIGWFRSLAKNIEASEGNVYVYIRARIDFLADVFVIRDKIDVEQIADGVTKHRARRLKRAVLDGTINNVNPEILENYTHNGFTTRRGLFANYSPEIIKRAARISQSHFDCTESGKAAHDFRVRQRNGKRH